MRHEATNNIYNNGDFRVGLSKRVSHVIAIAGSRLVGRLPSGAPVGYTKSKLDGPPGAIEEALSLHTSRHFCGRKGAQVVTTLLDCVR